MANRTSVNTDLTNYVDKGRVVTWSGLLNGDIGVDYDGTTPGEHGFAGADRSIQVTGTWGAGGSFSFEGSNDGTTWFILTDHLGNALTFTANALKSIDQITRYVRPHVTAGDGTTTLVAILMSRRGGGIV